MGAELRAGAKAEVGVQEHNGQRAVVMRTNRGDGGSAELHTAWAASPYKFTAGRRYLLRTEYANVGTQNGSFEVRFDAERPPVKNAIQLKPTRGEWQTADLRFTAPVHERHGTYYTHARAVAPDYMVVRSVQLFELPGEATPPPTAPVQTVYEIDFGAEPAFRGRLAKPGGLTMEQGKLPDGWNAFVWRNGASGEVARIVWRQDRHRFSHNGRHGMRRNHLTHRPAAEGRRQGRSHVSRDGRICGSRRERWPARPAPR